VASANETNCGDVMEIQSRRAVKGGETIGGNFYRGGQFIPKDVLAAQAGLDKRSTTAGVRRIENAVKKGTFNSFFHAAASIRKSARVSIESSDKPGRRGGPIRTKRGRGGGLARRSVFYAANKQGAVIGFSESRIDQAMEAHEHGKRRGGVRFPKRPTMQIALKKNLTRFHREWRWAIH
jgi:hypothetical protein